MRYLFCRVLPLCALFVSIFAFGPGGNKIEKKYPSLLWEITGNGITQPSYLFGTMHVSNKLVFNLGDSFYNAVEKVDYIGLELDPGYWQEYFSKTGNNMGSSNSFGSLVNRFGSMPGNATLTKSMFSVDGYEKKIENAISLEPTMINALLYRKSEYGADQEEDTYLDMYLYQICRKLNKKIAGLEVMETSERLRKEAMLSLQEDKTKARRDDDFKAPMSIQDAYKKGDLDLMDSMDRRATPQKKYRAIFIDQRNEIQAAGIDSVIKLKHTIFAGVGAAHLPGVNGVIEILRRKGYKLRPVKMEDRNSTEKDKIDKIRFPVKFVSRYTHDSVVKASVPGEWYRFRNAGNVIQYADLANGSYYMLNRVATDAAFWGHNQADVLRKVDSVLYETIPGKILTKTSFVKNGYKGYDITNRTRRGDMQRYQITITPFEVIIAKMSGTGDYVSTGTEANTFFNSIEIRQIEKGQPVLFQPSWGAFSVQFPHEPFIKSAVLDNTLKPYKYEAIDTKNGVSYYILKSTKQRSSYIEEDTFELNLLHESYMSSKMVEKELSKKFVRQNGFPALEATYKLKEDDGYAIARYVIQGPHYFTILAVQKKPFTATPSALTSFHIQPFNYTAAKLQKDTLFGFSFQSPVNLPSNEGASDDLKMLMSSLADKAGEVVEMLNRYVVIPLAHDSTGELITISGVKFPPYSYMKDTADFDRRFDDKKEDSAFIILKNTTSVTNGWRISEKWLTDTNSTRMLHNKQFYKQGVMFGLSYYSDTITKESAFAKAVFSSFQPADTIKGMDLFSPKGPMFFAEYASKDSATKARALSNLSSIQFKKEDVPNIEKSLLALKWGEPNYLGIKKRFITSLGTVEDESATKLLKKLYENANDTAMYQQEILNSLLTQKTKASFKAFEELVTNNPPVEVDTYLDDKVDGIKDAGNMFGQAMSRLEGKRSNYYGGNYSNNSSWGELSDSLLLTKEILPGLLALMNLDDYKKRMEEIVVEMADSGYVSPDALQPYYTKFLLEARQQFKKAMVKESQTEMKKKAAVKKEGEEDEEDSYNPYRYGRSNNNNDNQYNDLYDKMVLLMPFYEKQQAVKDMVQQSFKLTNEEYRYKMMKLLIRKNLNTYPDTLLNYYGKSDKYRRRLYYFLTDYKKMSLFPQPYNNALDLAKSRIKGFNSPDVDTSVFMTKRPFVWKEDKGDVYFFKYKIKDSDNWKWAMIGIADGTTKGTWNPAFDMLDDATTKILDADKADTEEVATLLKEKLWGLRPCAYSFYEDTDRRSDYSSYFQRGRGDEDDDDDN